MTNFRKTESPFDFLPKSQNTNLYNERTSDTSAERAHPNAWSGTHMTMATPFSITQPVSIFPSTKLDGSPSRRLVVSVQPSELVNIPEELFAIKTSQSKKPERAGKLVFKYFSYKASETATWSDLASTQFNIATPLAEIKKLVVSMFGQNLEAKVQFTVNMPGKFANIDTADGRYSIFDFNTNPDGNLGYYLKGGTVVTVTFTPAEHQGNEYLRIKLDAGTQTPEDIFVKGGHGKVYGQDDDVPAQNVYTGAADEGADERAATMW